MTHFRSPLEVSDFLMKKTNKTYLGNLLIKSHFLFNHEKVYQIFEKKNRIVNQEVATDSYSYNQFHNNLRLFDVLLNFSFTTSETMGDYYL